MKGNLKKGGFIFGHDLNEIESMMVEKACELDVCWLVIVYPVCPQ